MSLRKSVLGIVVPGLMGMLGATPAAAAAGSYIRPTVNGIAVDHCATWGTGCGQAGANQFCRTQGYSTAQAFTVYRPGRTYVLGSQQVCQGGVCVGLDQVTCTGGGGGGITYNYPQLGGSVVDHCATWGANCGQAGADQFCRVAGRPRATAFQVYRPGRTYVIGSQRTCEGGNCVGFLQVTCDASTFAAPPVTPPVLPPITPPPPPVTPPANATRATWYTRTEGNAPNGQRLSFYCPPLGADGYLSIWGTDVYTHDSGVCLAGVHVGTITRERGGLVTVEMREGQSSYPASVRNGISSQGYGAYHKSFFVVR